MSKTVKNVFTMNPVKNFIEKHLSPKNIVIDAIKTRLEGTGIIRMIIVFCLTDNTYNINVKNSDGKSTKIDISADEMNTLKQLYISRLVASWKARNKDKDVKAVYIQIDLEKESFEVYIEDMCSIVHKFI